MSAYEKFLRANDYRQDGYVFADSPSWESVGEAVSEWFSIIPMLQQTGGMEAITTTLSVLVECIYYAGYKRGKQESPPFLLPKED